MVLLSASGALAFVLHHDGVGLGTHDAANAPVGSAVRLRGTPAASAPLALRPLLALVPGNEASRLGNFTYVLDAGDLVLWLTSTQPRPAGVSAVIEGTVVARTHTTEHTPRPVVVVRVESWTLPLLFR